MANATNKLDFEGVVIRMDTDGYGIVEFDGPGHDIGVFTGEVLQDPRVARRVQAGQKVVGRAEKRGSGFRILRIEPTSC